MVNVEDVYRFLTENGFKRSSDGYWYKTVRTQFQGFECRAYVTFRTGFYLGFKFRREDCRMQIKEENVTMRDVRAFAHKFNQMFRHISGEK